MRAGVVAFVQLVELLENLLIESPSTCGQALSWPLVWSLFLVPLLSSVGGASQLLCGELFWGSASPTFRYLAVHSGAEARPDFA